MGTTDSKKWYAINSVNPRDIRPDFRRPGGGVTESDMVDTETEALEQCIDYLKQRRSCCDQLIKEYESRIAHLRAVVVPLKGEPYTQEDQQ